MRPKKYSDHFLEIRKSIPNTDVSGIVLKEVRCKSKKCGRIFKTMKTTKFSYCNRICFEDDTGLRFARLNKKVRDKIQVLKDTHEEIFDEVMDHDEEGAINEIIGKAN